jgi:hypothetical protein
MKPYTKMEGLYHGIFMRLSNADHDFMKRGGEGPRSSKDRVRRQS